MINKKNQDRFHAPGKLEILSGTSTLAIINFESYVQNGENNGDNLPIYRAVEEMAKTYEERGFSNVSIVDHYDK